LVVLTAALLTAACATVPLEPPGPPRSGAAVPGFAFPRDTFEFPNEIRARHPDREDLYANYCFVLARGLRQFFAFARFEPAAPRLDHDAYVGLVRDVARRPAWEGPAPAGERVVIPGYASLRDFSRGEEAALKAGLGGRFWTLVHWTNWRVTFPVTGGHQASVAQEVIDELRAGRLVQLLVTNWPKPELNHTVVAYAYREADGDVEFEVWDPNDPAEPGTLVFQRARARFWATRIYDTEPGPIRAFRMAYSWLL
jgi:hypothetical protein